MQSTPGSEEVYAKATRVQVDQVHTAASVCVEETVVQVEQVHFRDEFGTFYLTYKKNCVQRA